jgi:hypothetical protein
MAIFYVLMLSLSKHEDVAQHVSLALRQAQGEAEGQSRLET